jgi:predicted nucleic acid-binding protein
LILIDSCGWIEYFGEGPLADRYATFIEKTNKNEIVTPTIIIYEVYKKIKCIKGEEKALEAYAQMSLTRVVELTSSLSLKAADVSISKEIAMADAIVIATANDCRAEILTSDQHFKNIDGVKFISKQS